MGAARQLLRPHSPGFQAGRWVIIPLLSGISYFRSCIYILEAAARCCQMPTQANGPSFWAHLLPCSHQARWQLVAATRPAKSSVPSPNVQSHERRRGDRLDPGLGEGGLAAFPAEDACHFPNPLKSWSLGPLLPTPRPRCSFPTCT